jgi:predicted RNase H-like HicB family nuclease
MTSDRAKIVRIKIEEGKTGLFFATSPDLPGLLVAEPTIDELDQVIPQAIAELLEAMCGAKVVVTKAKDDSEFHPWVAMPLAVARRVGEKAA